MQSWVQYAGISGRQSFVHSALPDDRITQ